MPLVRVTNDQRQTRVFYDKTRRAIAVEPGKSAEIDFDEGGYERARVKALAKVGPKIEVLKPKVAAPHPKLIEEVEAIEDAETEAPRRKGRPRKFTAG